MTEYIITVKHEEEILRQSRVDAYTALQMMSGVFEKIGNRSPEEAAEEAVGSLLSVVIDPLCLKDKNTGMEMIFSVAENGELE